MSIYNSEYINLTPETIKEWLTAVIMNGVGYVKVTDKRGNYIIYDDGIFSMKYNGITTQIYKSKKTTMEIFSNRITIRQNLEHDGYRYIFDRGRWKRSKATTIYD